MTLIRAGDPIAPRTIVLFEGVNINDICFAADDEEGWADVYVLDADGRKQIDAAHEEVLWERRYGFVKFVNKEPS